MWWDDSNECASIQRGEQRVQLPFEGSSEGVDVGLCFCVVEGDLAFFIVQVDTQASRHEVDGQQCLRLGADLELVRAAPQGPVSVLWGHGEPALTL